MSTQNEQINNLKAQESPCIELDLIISPKEKDLGDGFHVRRLLPFAKKRMVGPWVFFDHMGPASLTAEKKFDVRPHPHINLATVTYLFEGEILHRDSLGNEIAIQPGAVNLMVAGRGITHSERERPEARKHDRQIHGLQLWLALPEEDEECEPDFHHYPKSSLPAFEVDGVPVRLLIGSAYGQKSPVKTFSETLYFEARLQKGESLEIADSPERAVYVASGRLQVSDTIVDTNHMAILNPCKTKVTALEESFVAVIGGAPLNKRFMEWNFISSRKERIEQAKEDWREGRFPKVPGDSEEFIPYP